MIKIKKVFLLLLLAVFMLFAFSGCADEQTEDPAAAGEGESITISGLPDGEIKITIDKIKALPAESGEAVSISSSGEESTVPFKGVALNTILEKHGSSLDDYTSVRLVAADGYSVEVPEDILRSKPFYLAYELHGEPIREKDRPLRVVIPDVRSLYWIKALAEVQLIAGGGSAVKSLYIFENTPAVAGAESAESDIDLKALLGIEEEGRVTIIAADGLVKKETLEAGKNYFISRTGEDAPEFYSPAIPTTMYVKKTAVLIHGDSAYLVVSALDAGEGKVSGELFLNLLERFLAEEGVVLHGGADDQRELAAEDLAGITFVLKGGGVVLQ